MGSVIEDDALDLDQARMERSSNMLFRDLGSEIAGHEIELDPPESETMGGTSLRRPDGSNYEIVGQEYPSHEMVECAGLENDGDVLEQRRQHRSRTGRARIHPYMCSEEQHR